jgi:hypothetical protein
MVVDSSTLLSASLRNQHLLKKAPSGTVVSDLCGLQAQFANNPKYALWIRGSDFDEDHWYGGLVKTWTLRGTLHTVPEEELGLFLSARGRPDGWSPGWNMEGRRMEYWSGFLLEQITGGICGREELKTKCRQKGISPDELSKVFHGWGGLMYEMSRRGLISYHPGTAKKFVPCSTVSWIEKNEARIILLRRYFRTFGPATIEDFLYFTGYKKRDFVELIKSPVAGSIKNPALWPEQIDPELRVLSYGGKNYYYAGELPGPGEIPPCIFLTGFDQLLMGYRDRSRLLDERYKDLVTTNSGIVFPTVLLRGRLRAKWKKDGETLLITAFDRFSRQDKRLITETAGDIFGGKINEICFK